MRCPKAQITFTEEMLEKLKNLAEKSGNPVSAIVRIAVAEYLEKEGTGDNVVAVSQK